MELDAGQIILLGFVAMLLGQGYKLVAAKWGSDVGKKVVTIVVTVLSVVLAYFWMKPQVPEFTDPMTFASQLIVLAGAVIGFATLIYNVVMEKIFSVFGLVKERFLIKR